MSYRIVVAVGDPDQLRVLLAVAVPLAREKGGHVLPLYVGTTDKLPPWLYVQEKVADVVGAPIMRLSRNIDNAVLDAIRDLNPDLLLLHWEGDVSRGRYLLGKTLDPIVQYAACNVAVVRPGEPAKDFEARMAHVERILVPSGAGGNASLALALGLDMAPQAEITALRVALSSLGPTAMRAQWDLLQSVLEPWADEERLQARVVKSSSVVGGMKRQAEQDYDLVLIGATQQKLVDRLLFGNLPQTLAESIDLPLIIVRRRHGFGVGALHRARWRLVQLLPQLTEDERIGLYRRIRRDARADKDFYVMMVLAAAIASLGLMLNSPAVIIGAMLMAPLMSALLGIGLGVVQGDVWLLRISTRTAIMGIGVVLIVSCLVGLLVPDRRVTGEMLGRSSPTLLDLAVALGAGAGAAYGMARRDMASALPGVAIAVALVPPLATVGLAMVIANRAVATGAALLFLTNLVAIVSAAGLVFFWMGFHPDSAEELRARTFRGGLIGTLTLLVVIGAILGTLTVESIRRGRLHAEVQEALDAQLGQMRGVTISRWDILSNDENTLHIEVSVHATRNVAHREVVEIQQQLAIDLQRVVQLSLTVIPMTKLDPFMPPTLTPTATPTSTPTGRPTSTETVTPSATCTCTPTPTSTHTAEPTATPTHTLTPTPSDTPTSTDTPTPTNSPTPTASLTPMPGWSFASTPGARYMTVTATMTVTVTLRE